MEPHYRTLRSKLSGKKAGLSITAFVAGPFVKPEWFESYDGVQCNATKARIEIIKALKEWSVGVIIGEHKQLEGAASEILGEWVDASSSELFAAQDCDFIVILPSSPGSFCELGSWHILEWAAKKMLIIVDKEFESDKSFISEGIIPRAKSSNARVEYEQYSDISSIINIVYEYYGRVSANKAVSNAVKGV